MYVNKIKSSYSQILKFKSDEVLPINKFLLNIKDKVKNKYVLEHLYSLSLPIIKHDKNF